MIILVQVKLKNFPNQYNTKALYLKQYFKPFPVTEIFSLAIVAVVEPVNIGG